MISINALTEFSEPIRYRDGEVITLEIINEAIATQAESMGIPVMLVQEQIKSGSFFKPVLEDCLVAYHPEHQKDYYNFCVRVSKQGSYAFVTIYSFGNSKQFGYEYDAEQGKKEREGMKLSEQLGSLAAERPFSLGKNKVKLEQEKMYYECFSDVLRSVFYND